MSGSPSDRRARPVTPCRLLQWGIILLTLSGAVSAEPPPERRADIRHLVLQDCGSCHGLRLQGGLGPALTPSALEGRAPAELAATIKYGRAGTAMPPWEPFLTDREIRWIVEALKRGRFLE